MKKALYIGGGAVAAAAIGVMAYSFVTFRKVMGRAEEPFFDGELAQVKPKLVPYAEVIHDSIGLLKSEKTELVYTQSYDGLRLAGLFLPAEDGRATVILMHGFRSTPYGDFSGIVRKYHEMGLNLLIPYQRAHGKSEGKYLTFGVKERRDVHSWINWVTKRLGADEKILVDGMSMGCATVLMASELGYPDNVKGIIADCGYTTPYDIVAHVIKTKMHLPKYPFIIFFGGMCRAFAHFSLKECSATEAMKKNPKPTLFVHGEADDFVPYEMTVKNHDACAAEKVFVSIPKAGHGMCYFTDTEYYDRELERFIEKVLK